jgi:hypothetical protein
LDITTINTGRDREREGENQRGEGEKARGQAREIGKHDLDQCERRGEIV